MARSERPLTKAERAMLLDCSSFGQKRSNAQVHVFGFLMLAAALAFILGLVWKLLSSSLGWPDFEAVKWWLLLFAGAVSAALVGRLAIKEQNSIASQDGAAFRADQDLRNGTAVVEEFEVCDVVEVEEFDDEGAGFLLELKDGRVLFLVGQDLYPYSLSAEPDTRDASPDMIFPSDMIELVYAPLSGVTLGSRGTGAHLKPRALVRWQGDGPRSSPYTGPLPYTFSVGPIADVISRAGLKEFAV